MLSHNLKRLPLLIALSIPLFSSNIDTSILREIKLLKLSEDKESVKKDSKKEKPFYTSAVDSTEQKKIKEIIELYSIKEYNSSLYLLDKVNETNNIKNFKTMLKILIKLNEGKDVKAELDYLLTFPFVDYFFISEIHKNLLINNKTKDSIFFLEHVKTSPFSFLKSLNFSQGEIDKLNYNEYFDTKNINIEKDIKLAKAYEKVDMLLDAYETYKQNNANEKYSAQINELKRKINYRIKLYSNYEEKNDNMNYIIKNYKNANLFKMYKERKDAK